MTATIKVRPEICLKCSRFKVGDSSLKLPGSLWKVLAAQLQQHFLLNLLFGLKSLKLQFQATNSMPGVENDVIHRIEALVHRIEALVHCIKALVYRIKALIYCIKALINRFEALINLGDLLMNFLQLNQDWLQRFLEI